MALGTFRAAVAVPLSNAGAYTTGQAIGTTLTLALGSTGGVIDFVRLSDIGQSGAVDIVFFASPPAVAQGDRTTFALNAADRSKVIAVISVPAAGYIALGASNGQGAPTAGLPIQAGQTGDGNLYAQLIARATITYATGDLILSVGSSS